MFGPASGSVASREGKHMLIRRAAVTAGLTLGLVAAGVGPVAADDGGSLLGDPAGTVTDTVEGVEDTMSHETGPVQNMAEEQVGDLVTNPVQTQSTEEGSGPADPVDDVGAVTQQAPAAVPTPRSLPVQGDALVNTQGACADVASESDPPPCESETLGSQTLNACVEDDGGLVSTVAGGGGGLAESVGLSCTARGVVMPPPGGAGGGVVGGVGGGAIGGGGGVLMPPPMAGVPTANGAEAVTAAPKFAG